MGQGSPVEPEVRQTTVEPRDQQATVELQDRRADEKSWAQRWRSRWSRRVRSVPNSTTPKAMLAEKSR